MKRTIAALTLLSLSGCNSYPSVKLDSASPTPLPPTGLAADATDGEVHLEWAANAPVDNVATYSVYSAATPWTTWSPSLTGAQLSTGLQCCTFTRSSLTNETEYWFSVSALNPTGESLPTAQIPSKPPGWKGTILFGTPGTEYAHGIVRGSDGSLYTLGSTNGAIEGNTNQGERDLFVTKHDASGNRLWVRQYGSTASDSPTSIAIDGTDQFLYVAGYTLGDFGGANQGLYDAFVAKFRTSDGGNEWIRPFGTTGSDLAHGVAVSPSGAIYVAGATEGSLGSANVGFLDLFLRKYDSGGFTIWTRQLGTTNEDVAYSVATDGGGHVYVSGHTYSALDGNVANGMADLFLVQYDEAGIKNWTRQRGTAAAEDLCFTSVDGAGNVYVAGTTTGALDGNALQGFTDVYVIRYDVDGNRQWTKQLGSPSDDNLGGISIDGTGRILVVGSTVGSLGGEANSGSSDAYVAQFAPADGAVLWVTLFGTTSQDVARASTTGPNGTVFVTGSSTGVLSGEPNAGLFDLFLGKFDQDGIEQ